MLRRSKSLLFEDLGVLLLEFSNLLLSFPLLTLQTAAHQNATQGKQQYAAEDHDQAEVDQGFLAGLPEDEWQLVVITLFLMLIIKVRVHVFDNLLVVLAVASIGSAEF